MKRRVLAAAIVSLAASACGTAISGDVATRYDRATTIRWLAGTKVYLVPATAQNIAALGKGCDVASDWYDRYRAEHARLSRLRAAHAAGAAAYADSLARLPASPPDDPDSLAGPLSERVTAIDARGHYAFSNIRPGRYFVVTPGVGWTGAVVGRLPLHLDLRIERLRAACAVLGTASP